MRLLSLFVVLGTLGASCLAKDPVTEGAGTGGQPGKGGATGAGG
jgi:hypothetical protein